MAKKKSDYNNQINIRVNEIDGNRGNVNISGGDITTYQTTTGLSAAEIKQLFDQLYSAIEVRSDTSPVTQADLKAELQEVQSAVTQAVAKNEKMDENFLSRHFRNIARMAPDILDVVVASLGNPLAGLGVVAKKIADKAKLEAA
jgi:hypothetical protein